MGLAGVLGNPEDATIRSLYEWMKSQLAEHKMPMRWWVNDEIPRTSRGTINRDAVKAFCVPRDALDLSRILAGE